VSSVYIVSSETLGRMLDYLSSELAHSAVSPQARDLLEPGGGEERRGKEQDHIFGEIVKVTQSTVDRYLDSILLRTVYTSAHQVQGRTPPVPPPAALARPPPRTVLLTPPPPH
jgi:hypothetical protein